MIKFLKYIVILLALVHIWFAGYNKGFSTGHYIGASEALAGKITLEDLVRK